MSATNTPDNDSEARSTDDSLADARTIVVMFVALVLFAVHFASGWTFDF